MFPLSVFADKGNSLSDFETRAYELRMDLVHNHTFDQANIPIADSLYRESVERGSMNGKLYALQIKYYALANSANDSLFRSTVDEYISIAQELDYFEEYFDATSTKIQYEMFSGDYSRCMFMAHDMMKMAEKAHSNLGLYESNLLLGQIFKYRSSYNSALKYFNHALKYVEPDDSIPHFTLYREIAECYSGNMLYDKALKYAKLSIEWANYDIYRLYGEWTYLTELFQSFDIDAFRKALSASVLNDEEHYKSLPMDMQITLDAMKLTAQGKFKAARDKAMEHDTENRQLSFLVMLAQYEGDLSQAFNYLKRLDVVKDSIESELQDSELAELDIRLGKADAEYKAEQELNKRQQITAITVGALLLIVIVGMFVWIRKSRLQNEKLKLAQEAAEQKNRELTEAKLITEKALAEAENANAMRLHFIQNMTHEIRTPLNAIFGFTQLLTDDDMELDKESEAEMRIAISDSTMKLTSMIDNIIKLSNYDSHTVKIKKSAVSCRSIIEEAIHAMPPVDFSNVSFSIDLDNDIEIFTDAEKLISALSQVIFNAFKFTTHGTVKIGTNKNEREGYVTFYVEDTGKGVPTELSEKIFERFYKIDEFVPGTGLGLSLCRVIVESLGGEVKLDINYTGGSRFLVQIPASFNIDE